MFVVSDEHGGLVQAIVKPFQGASWQRCQVHRMHNLLSHAPVKVRAEVAAAAKLVLQAPDRAEAERRLTEFSQRFAKTAPKAVACLEAGFEDAMAVMAPPEKSRRRLRTTNLQERMNNPAASRGVSKPKSTAKVCAPRGGESNPERLNEEIRRRERVICIFPNDESALRLIGTLLAEQNDVWQERKYLDMDEFVEWGAARAAAGEGNPGVALAG